MEKRVALIGIVVENFNSVEALNAILHENSGNIIGRFGLPYKERNISIMSIAVDGSANDINTLCGKIGALSGVSSKTVFAKLSDGE